LTAEPPAFDPVAFKKTTRQGWDAVAEAWDRWTPVLTTWLGPVTEAMLDMAHLRAGDKVVDVAAGAGEPGLTAAERVGPTGSVLATDLSANILAFSDRAARERGVRKGDLLATVTGRDNALRLCGTFLQYYRENARWLERTYDFVPRVGLDELKALLLDDRDGIVTGLDERMQAAIDAYRDPWQEGREPVTSGQFTNSLPLVPLPRVPVRNGGAATNSGGPAAASPFAGGGTGTAARTEPNA
jgi:SAM-dependent methyltransferase